MSQTTFTSAVSGGLMPGGPLGQQLTNITNRAVIPTLVQQIYQTHPLLSLLLANAQMAKGGAGQITIPTQGSSFTAFNWGSFAGDFPMPEDQAAINNAQFNLKLGMVPIGFFNMEALDQSSDVIIPKLRAVTADAAVVIKQALAQSLYAYSLANLNALDSLVGAYDNGANYATYGGLAKTNAWWQGQYYPNQGGMGSVASRVGMANMIVRVQTGAGGEDPDFGVMNPADWATLMTDFQGFEQYVIRPGSRFGAGDVINSGFRAIQVLNTPIFSDPWCPRGEMYLINSRYLALYLNNSNAFTFTGFNSLIPLGQLASIGVLITALNLVCAKPSSGAHITGLATQAWPNVAGPPAVL